MTKVQDPVRIVADMENDLTLGSTRRFAIRQVITLLVNLSGEIRELQERVKELEHDVRESGIRNDN